MAAKPDQHMDADRVARGQGTPALVTPCIAIATRVWCSTRYALALAAVAFAGLPSAALAASVEDRAPVTVLAGRPGDPALRPYPRAGVMFAARRVRRRTPHMVRRSP